MADDYGSTASGIVVPKGSDYDASAWRADAETLGGGLYGSGFGAGTTGYNNSASGMGLGGMDKQNATQYSPYRLTLNYITLENMYNHDGLASRICEKFPDESVRKWIEVKEKEGQWLLDELKRLNARKLIKNAASQSRCFGGAAIVMILDDGLPPSEPLNMARVKKIVDLTVYDRFYLNPLEFDNNYQSSSYAEPESYVLEDGRIFHKSRIIKFRGRELPRRQMINNYWWGGSFLDLAWDSMRSYRGSLGDMRHMQTEASIPVVKIPKLTHVNAMGGTAGQRVQERLNQLNYSKSIYRTYGIDKEEEFSFVSRQLTGFTDMHKEFCSDLSVTMDMPEFILFGKAPSGLNASMSEIMEQWHASVEAYQELELTSQLQQLIDIISTISKKDAPSWEWAPLSMQKPDEIANTRLVTAQAMQIEKDALGLDDSEVRMIAKQEGELWKELADQSPLDDMGDDEDGEIALGDMSLNEPVAGDE